MRTAAYRREKHGALLEREESKTKKKRSVRRATTNKVARKRVRETERQNRHRERIEEGQLFKLAREQQRLFCPVVVQIQCNRSPRKVWRTVAQIRARRTRRIRYIGRRILRKMPIPAKMAHLIMRVA